MVMKDFERTPHAINTAKLLVESQFCRSGGSVIVIPPSHRDGSRGTYDLILNNPNFFPHPVYYRVHETSEVIRNQFHFIFHYPDEKNMIQNNPDNVLLIFTPINMVVFNPKKGIFFARKHGLINPDILLP